MYITFVEAPAIHGFPTKENKESWHAPRAIEIREVQRTVVQDVEN